MNLRIDMPQEPEAPNEALRSLIGSVTPREIFKSIDATVKGNDDLKKSYSVALYNHFKRFMTKANPELTRAPRNHLLFIGSTGCGKTFLAQTGAELVGFPVITIDCSSLVPSGIRGTHIISQLAPYAKIPNFEFAVVILDEFDKLGESNESGDLNYKNQIQSEMLRILEGTQLIHEDSGLSINTNNMLFILTGAFSGISKEEAAIKNGLGFNAKESNTYNEQKLLDKIIKQGFLPELMGRISFVGRIADMSLETIFQIMDTESGDLSTYINTLKDEGLEISIHEMAREAIAKRVLSLKTGARALKSILDHLFLEIQFEFTGLGEMVIEVTKEMVDSLPIGYDEVKDKKPVGF